MGRSCATAATLFVAAALLSGAGCDAEATAVEDCRDIERARCRAAQHCDLGIDTQGEVEACERYVRDHCLHGLAVKDEPSASDLRECVSAIEGAGTCAEQGPDTTAAACDAVDLARTDITVCELVTDPEKLPACFFLLGEDEPPPSQPEGGTPPEPEPTDAGDASG